MIETVPPNLDLSHALALHQVGQFDEAEDQYRLFLAGQPAHHAALHLLGMLCAQTGRPDEGIDLIERSIDGAPSIPEYRNNLGGLLALAGRHREAEACFREAIRLRPTYAEAHGNLGVAAQEQSRLPEAERHYREALRHDPGDPRGHCRLGNLLRKNGRLDEAAQAQHRALELRPNDSEALASLAAIRSEQGRSAEAVELLRRRAKMLPSSPRAGSDLLLALHSVEGNSRQAMFQEHQAWAARHAEPLYPRRLAAFRESGRSDRRLRIGYCSADLRDHPVARFFEPLIANHDRAQVEVYCYSDVPGAQQDATTDRLRTYADGWRDVAGLLDDQVAGLVRKDGIDILVDLAGHLNNPRLLLFALKPAPVQVSFLGYPNTTGLTSMDYRLTDALHDPPEVADLYHSERLIRLAPCAWCYRPDDHDIAVNALSALSTGQITFGCLNRLSKATPGMLRLWAEILAAVPHSRLMILTATGAEDDAGLVATLTSQGISAHRTIRVGRRPRSAYLQLYSSIDIALDSFPYNGHTTTLDALWMGVPTVTLSGQTHASRAGGSVLSQVGLEHLIASTPIEYVKVATRLASDLRQLGELRHNLRQKMASSALRDEVGYARRIEAVYRVICEAKSQSL